MALLVPQRPSLTTLITPTFNATSASDTFAASSGQAYLLYYVNGATATTGAIYVRDRVTVTPSGAIPAAPAAPAVTAYDALVIATTFPATNSRAFFIDDVLRFVDPATGLVTLLHGGTLTTLTLAILGPF